MPKRLAIIQHVAHEGPGRFVPHLLRLGFEPVIIRLDAGDALPDISTFSGLLVMGGPMGVGDVDNPRYPYLKKEIALLAQALRLNIPTVGVCLGAQLLAVAAGGTVGPMMVGEPPVHMREIGWGAVHFQPDRWEDPLLAGIGPSEVMMHWHGDAISQLPPGAVRLGSTLACHNQLVRIGRHHVAVQFHPECEEKDVDTWLAVDSQFVTSGLGASGALRIRNETAIWMPKLRFAGDRLCRNLAEIFVVS